MKTCLMGLGYIGLPTVIIATKHGVEIIGTDINARTVEVTSRGKLHIIEPGTEEISREVSASEYFRAYTEPRVNDVYSMVVPTPFKGDHRPDAPPVELAIRMVLPLLKEGDLYVIGSTSLVGTVERMIRLTFSEWPEPKDEICIACYPERMFPGNVIHKLVYNSRVIGGMDGISARKVMGFYGQFAGGTFRPTSGKTAKMCKLTEDSNRDVQIAFVNELSFICDKAGINVWELTDLANKHPRVNILWPGRGVDGHCIVVDPYFITTESPTESRMILTTREMNNYKAFWCAKKIRNAMLWFELKHGHKSAVTMMGLAFKPDIDDLRKSPARGVAMKVLQSCNNTDVMVVELNVSEHKLFRLIPYKEAYEKADIVVSLMNHREFAGLNYRDDVKVLDFREAFKK